MKLYWPGILFLLAACSQQQVSTPQKLAAFVAEPSHGLTQTDSIAHTAASKNSFVHVSYRPTDMMVAQVLSASKNKSNPKVLDSLRKHYGKHAYFVMDVTLNGKEPIYAGLSSKEQYRQRVEELSFDLGKMVHLETDEGVLIPLEDFAFPRLYGASGKNSFLVIFDLALFAKAKWVDFIFNDDLLGTGDHSFRFQVADLNQAPQLNF